MAAKGKGIALAVLGIGLVGGLALQGKAKAQPKALPPKKRNGSLSSKDLASKWAAKFGIPSSLVLATIYAQSGNNLTAYQANKHGGSWGLGQVTLNTAKEIYSRVKSLLSQPWDGTGKGLLQPDLNVCLTAYYLSLWFKRYTKNRDQWMLAAYAYVLGPGRVQKVVPNPQSPLPSPLPEDFAGVKRRYDAALKTLKQSGVAGAEPVLTGKALAAKIPSATTGYHAREMIGKMTGVLANAYATLKNYDPKGIAQKSGIDAGSVKAAKTYLDNANAALKKYYDQMPESNAPLTADLLNKLKVAVSTSSVAAKTVDDMFGTGWARELFGEVLTAGKQIIATAADTVGLSKTSAVIAVAGIAAAALLISAVKK